MDVNNIKSVVFFDLDGTLFNSDQVIPPENIAALKQLEENNILPVISTGRNIFEIKDLLKITGINTVVSANGSFVTFEGEPFVIEVINRDLIKRLVDFASESNEAIGFYNDQESAVSADNPLVRDNYKALHQKMTVNPQFPENNEVNFLITYTPDGSVNDKLDAYQKKFAYELTFYRNNPRGMDTVNYGVSKGTGIRKLLDKTGLNGVPTYGFGDGYNDLPMFEVVDHPVAMLNGVDLAKKHADYITTKTNDDGGIVEGLRHFHLI